MKLIDTNLNNISIFNVGNKEAVTIKEWIGYCEKVVKKKANIIEYDYKKNNRQVRDFFPFHNYSNFLDVSKKNEIYPYETKFEDGLENAFKWYCDNREQICFKEEVIKNEEEILNIWR